MKMETDNEREDSGVNNGSDIKSFVKEAVGATAL